VTSRGLDVVASVSFGLSAALFVAVGLSQVAYPGFTEPLEADVLQHIERVSRGLAIYVEPTTEYVPLAFMPLYYLLAAPFYRLIGDSFVGPRSLSFLLSLGSVLLVYLIARRESRDFRIGLLAAGFFMAGYRVSDAVLFSAMPDSALLFFLLLGVYFMSRGPSKAAEVAWIVSFTLAFWCKHQGATYALFAAAYALVVLEKALPPTFVIALFLLGGPIAFYMVGPLLGDRFFYFTLTVPGRWPHSIRDSVERMAYMVLCALPFVTILGGEYLRRAIRRRPLHASVTAWFVVASVVSTLFSMTSSGSSNNHYVPLLAALSLAGALGAQAALAQGDPRRLGVAVYMLAGLATAFVGWKFVCHERPFFFNVGWVALIGVGIAFWAVARAGGAERVRSSALVLLVACGHFAAVAYLPNRYMPAPGYRAGVHSLQAFVTRLDAPLLILPYGNVPEALTGKKIERGPSWVAFGDFLRGNPAARLVGQLKLRLDAIPNYYILSESPIEEVTVYSALASRVELVQDFRDEFAGVGQIAVHWYTGREHLRYLYRRRPVSEPSRPAQTPLSPGS
jgi:hypothetical protein